MTVDYGIFCDTCKEFAELGEWLFIEKLFQKNEKLYLFLRQHVGHLISLHTDADDQFLDKVYDGHYQKLDKIDW